MSEQDLENARRSYEHFIATGEPLDAVHHPDFVLDMSKFRGWPEQQTYEGMDGFREFLASWFGTWEEGGEFELVELREVDGKILALIDHRGRSKSGGVPVEVELAHVLTFKDGKLFRLVAYMSHAEGMAAVGLEPEEG